MCFIMKKIFLVFILSLLCSFFVHAIDFEIDGIRYRGQDTIASVIGVTSKDITSVTIDETISYRNNDYKVTSIGVIAFSGCSNLSSVSLPESITIIDDGAFGNCTSLNYIELPQNLTTLGKSAFQGCKSLDNLFIPKDVSYIGVLAFYECDNLAHLNVDELNNYFCSDDGMLFTKDKEEILFFPMGKRFDESLLYRVKRVGPFTFAGHDEIVGTLTIPINIDFLGESAFESCLNITELIISDCNNIIEVDRNYIYNCPITKIYYGRERKYTSHMYENNYPNTRYNTVNTIVFGDSIKRIIANEFRDCISINSVVFGEGLETIQDFAFTGCIGLRSIILPQNLKRIERSAFWKSYLTSIIIPNNVEFIGTNSFSQCPLLKSVIIKDAEATIEEGAFLGDNNLTDLDLGNRITSIGVYAFSGCKLLKTITFPNTLTQIGLRAFWSCSSLDTIFSKIENPFSFPKDVFPNNTYSSAILYVPVGTQEKYWSTYYWASFNTIIEKNYNEIKGDVNNDGEINIADINAVIDQILSAHFTNSGDVNNDGEVNIADINTIIDIILSS